MQPLTNTTPGEHVGMAEPAPAPLGLSAVGELLRERGYGLSCRFGHVHATRWSQEWHICLVADLAAMTPSRLLVCLEEAIRLSLDLERVR